MNDYKEMFPELKHLPQECEGNYQFNSRYLTTQGFLSEFGDEAQALALVALFMCQERSESGADYLQIFEFNGKKFWLIDDETHITALLPSEY